jgi:hypothetical protein
MDKTQSQLCKDSKIVVFREYIKTARKSQIHKNQEGNVLLLGLRVQRPELPAAASGGR